jgi:SAM-dependent methyltransferase
LQHGAPREQDLARGARARQDAPRVDSPRADPPRADPLRADAPRAHPAHPSSAKLERYRDARVAETYDRRWSGRRGLRRQRRKERAVLRAVDSLGALGAPGPPAIVLDVPCGSGRFTELLCARGPLYVGLDLSLAMLLQARAKAPLAHLAAADLARLPLRDSAVDLVVCIRLMHLVRDAELRLAFLREMARVARRGIVVDYRQSGSLQSLARRLRFRAGLRSHEGGALPPAAIRRELAAAGLAPRAWLPLRAPFSDKLVIAAEIPNQVQFFGPSAALRAAEGPKN